MQLIYLLLHSIHKSTHTLGQWMATLQFHFQKTRCDQQRMKKKATATTTRSTLIQFHFGKWGDSIFSFDLKTDVGRCTRCMCWLAGQRLAYTCTERELLNWHWKLTFSSDQFVKFSFFFFRFCFPWNFNAHTIIMSNKRQRRAEIKIKEKQAAISSPTAVATI